MVGYETAMPQRDITAVSRGTAATLTFPTHIIWCLRHALELLDEHEP